MFFIKILLLTHAAQKYSYIDYSTVLTFIFTFIFAFAGLAVFANWAIKTNFGKSALERAIFRANSMPYYVPFAVLLGWIGLSITASIWAQNFHLADWQRKFFVISLNILIEIIIAVFIIAAAKKYFYNGLKGFGLHTENISKDFSSAIVILISIWPLVMGALYLTIIVGKIFAPDFQMEQNEGLTVILGYKQWPIRILMILFATILTPFFEELVFRGFVQSFLRDISYSPWRSIIATSVVFTILHPLTNFPGLLILSLAMGYAYEKSGSLWRSIFLHCIFNSTQIAFALLS